ncbi:MAG: prephenate dehydrogenase/arogenate dehydrogenase family protein [Nitrososphaerota archaeon]|nr:prephenate dehydrogenase/arogenate dehydrogenase family protein [Nitrososphaerota archaeon]
MKVAVIGAAGKMGQLFTEYFVKEGHSLILYDVKTLEVKKVADRFSVNFARSLDEALKDIDVICVSVPIETTPKVLQETSRFLKKGMVVMEIASFKCGVVEVLKRIADLGVTTLSIHPLFGPGAKDLRGKVMALIPILDEANEIATFQRIFPTVKMVKLEAEEHDYLMAIILSLTYFTNIVFSSTIMDKNPSTLRRMSGTNFKIQLTLMEAITSEDPDLILSLMKENKFALDCISKFIENAKSIYQMLYSNDTSKFKSLIGEVKAKLMSDERYSQSYQDIYRILDLLN